MIFKNWKISQKKILKYNGYILASLILPVSLFGFFAKAYDPQKYLTATQVPEELQDLQINEKIGSVLDLNLSFTDDSGQTVPLKKYFQSNQPVLMTIVYYGCPNLCTLHLNGLGSGLKPLPDTFKQQFEWVVISMDHRETTALAAQKKQNYAKKYLFPPERMHFLTGSPKNISSISQNLGFRFRWDENQKIYAHLPVAYVLTPTGIISRYLYGVEFSDQVLKLSLVESGQGRIGTIIDRVLLFCFQFDPKRSQYSWYAYNIMRAGGLITLLLLLGFLIPVWIKENRKLKKRLL